MKETAFNFSYHEQQEYPRALTVLLQYDADPKSQAALPCALGRRPIALRV